MGIVAPEIGSKSFGTFKKQAPELHSVGCIVTSVRVTKCPLTIHVDLDWVGIAEF